MSEGLDVHHFVKGAEPVQVQAVVGVGRLVEPAHRLRSEDLVDIGAGTSIPGIGSRQRFSWPTPARSYGALEQRGPRTLALAQDPELLEPGQLTQFPQRRVQDLGLRHLQALAAHMFEQGQALLARLPPQGFQLGSRALAHNGPPCLSTSNAPP
ncbi:MAG: hypothetical protein R3E68_12590 [Burkholderiaceae bacterium]